MRCRSEVKVGEMIMAEMGELVGAVWLDERDVGWVVG